MNKHDDEQLLATTSKIEERELKEEEGKEENKVGETYNDSIFICLNPQNYENSYLHLLSHDIILYLVEFMNHEEWLKSKKEIEKWMKQYNFKAEKGELDISGTHLTFIPHFISYLTNLQTLICSDNELKKLPP